MQTDELAMLPLQIPDPPIRERFERASEPPSALPRVLRNTAFLAPIARQKDDDAIRLTELVGPEDQRVGGVKGHTGRLQLYYISFDGHHSGVLSPISSK